MTPRPPLRASRRAFTLMELLVAATMLGVIMVAALFGFVSLQKSYAATEEYGTGLADQMRLLDYLAQDLRRATTPPTMDPDGEGVQITVPDYYRFNASDPQHLFPVVNDAQVSSDGTDAVYFDPANPAVTTQTIIYRFAAGSITRVDPWAPLVASSANKGTYVSSGPVTIASNMDAFPTITADSSDPSGATLRYNVTFHSIFQPLAAANQTNAITLHNVTFVRSKDLSH